MNKKIISGILACTMAFSVFGVAACKEDPKSNQGGTENNQNNQGTGGQNELKPGAVVTDEKTKNDIYGAISETTLGGLTYSASANLSFGEGETLMTQKAVFEGAARFDKSAEADAYGYLESKGGEDALQYLLFFVRGENAYFAMGDEEGEKVDVSKLKERLKKDIVLSPLDLSGIESFTSPAAVKLLKNLTSLFEGKIVKTEGGYSLEYDVVAAVKKLFSDVENLAGTVDATPSMTLTALFGQQFITDTLTKLLKGVTATELREFAEPLLPDELKDALPEAGATQTAFDYVLGLLRSGDFYTALTGETEFFEDYKTFGAIPLKELVDFLSGGSIDLSTLKLKNTLHGLGENLEDEALSLLTNLLGLDGKAENATLELVARFDLSNDKKLLGFSLDCAANGTLTPEESGEESGEKSGEESEKTNEPQAQAEGAEEKNDTQESGSAGKSFKATLKMETAIASSPQLFDLTGCKYEDSDGEKTINAA